MSNNKIIYKRTLNEYNKRYRHHKNLLKFTKKEVEEFDRHANTVGEHYLLRNNNWWLIGDTYYQAPKALHHYWFRNLNAGAQTAICLLGAGIVATSATLPFVLHQVAEPDVSIESADKVEWSNKHYDAEGNACITIKGKGDNKISSIKVNIENYECIENTDFTYNKTNGELIVKKACITAHPGKIDINPQFEEPVSEDCFTFTQIDETNNCEVALKSGITLPSDASLTIPTIGKCSDGIERTVTKIAEGGFSGFDFVSLENTECKKIKSITLPSTLLEIADYGFCNTDKLESITIPSTVQKIGVMAFYGLDVLKALVEETIEYTSVLNSIIFEPNSQVNSVGKGAFAGLRELKTVSIPSSLTTLGEEMFTGDYNLEDVELTDKTIEIGENCFTNCTKLSTIDLSHIEIIKEDAFNGCTNLSSNDENELKFNSLVTLDSYAFHGCEKIEKVSLPNTLVFDDSVINPFEFCVNLKTITGIGGGWETGSTLIKNNCLYNKNTTSGLTLVSGCINSVIEDTTAAIHDNAFRGTGISSITIPDSVVSIRRLSFSNCPKLKSVKIGSGLKIMHSEFTDRTKAANVFIGCPLLESVEVNSNNPYFQSLNSNSCITGKDTYSYYLVVGTLKTDLTDAGMSGVTEIGSQAFYGLDLKTITIPNNITKIGSGAFCKCDSLASAIFNDTTNAWNITNSKSEVITVWTPSTDSASNAVALTTTYVNHNLEQQHS